MFSQQPMAVGVHMASGYNLKSLVTKFLIAAIVKQVSTRSPNGSALSRLIPPRSVSETINSLLDGYDKRLRPNVTGSAVEVEVEIKIVSFAPISEANMEYTVTMYFRQYWKDSRLVYGNMVELESLKLTEPYVDQIWTPDTFFTNELSDHVVRENSLLLWTKDGSVLLSSRKRIRSYCPMDFHKFPLDLQRCNLSFESYAYNINEVIYKWKNGKPITFKSPVKISHYNLSSWNIHRDIVDYGHTGNFSCLYATFEFDRDTRYYLVQSYLPAALIVILSWLGFWIDERAVPARVSLGITTILSITTLFFGIQTLLPKVGYLKAVDVYLFGSLLFVFGALVEYALICWHSKGLEGKVSEIERQKAETRVRKRNWWDLQEHPKKSKTEEGLIGVLGEGVFDKLKTDRQPQPKQVSWLNSRRDLLLSMAGKSKPNSSAQYCVIDRISRVIFPLSYILFNIIYIIVYILK